MCFKIVVYSVTAAIFIGFCLKKLNVFSQHIGKKWIIEFCRTNSQELKCWSTFCVNYFLRYYLMMQHRPVVKRVNGTHEWAHRPYQLLSAPYHCCLYKCRRQDERQPLQSSWPVPIFSCDQAALWMVFSVRLSVCLSVCLSVTPFWLCSHHRIIMKFSGVITTDKSDVHAKGQGQRSKVKVTEVNTQLNRFRTVTPVWIHIWWWNDAYSLMMLRRGALLFLKVIRQILRSHGSKKRHIWPRLGVSGL